MNTIEAEAIETTAVRDVAPASLVVAAPNVKELAGPVAVLCGDAEALEVDSPEMCQHAGALVKRLLERAKALEDKRFEFTRPLDELKAKFVAEFRPSIEALRTAADVVKRKALTYTAAEERRRREAQAAAEEAARKERERLAREAARLEAKGKVEQAEAKRELAATMPSVAVMPPVAAVRGGITYRDKWRGRVTDKAALVKCLAKRPEYLGLLDVNQGELDKLAGVLKLNLVLDGVTVENEKIPVAPR